MLIISRRLGETIEIRPVEGAEHLTLFDVFGDGAIRFSATEIHKHSVRIAIDAPPELKIWRCDGPLTRDEAWAVRDFFERG